MVTNIVKASIFILLCAVAAGLAFGEGEWENPGNGNGNGNNGGADTEQVSVGVEQSEPSTTEIVSADDTVTLDEPQVVLLVDNFPIIHADEAPPPMPRNPKRILDAVNMTNLAEKLEADRLLLSEIRKDVPAAREEAELYLFRLKELAEKSDPARLAPLFDRVIDQAPIYFKWLETEYENSDEQVTEYYVGGARGFSFAMENFKSAVFFVIMNRLDIASRVISELDE